MPNTQHMIQQRIDEVVDAIAALGYDGIVAFDHHEPEYETLETLYEEYDDETFVKLLAICATTEDYQLNGDAQRFWRVLTKDALAHGQLASVSDVKEILGAFMEADVNARLNQQKRDRLIRLFENGFGEWFVNNHADVEALTVWEHLADALNNRRNAKTVVLSMKIYDIAHLIRHGNYLEFPQEIPIPCDLQVERVSRTSGITTSEDTDTILRVWAEVMDGVSQRLGRPISLLRIDSIVWQAGQIIGKQSDAASARAALIEHFDTVGIDSESSTRLADELTGAMDR